MPDRLSILCVHGIGHGEVDPALEPSWTGAITADLQRWNAELIVEFQFLRYDDLFDHAPLNPATYAGAVARFLVSGITHGVGDLFTRSRGLLEFPDQVRWTAGMVAQWATEDALSVAE